MKLMSVSIVALVLSIVVFLGTGLAMHKIERHGDRVVEKEVIVDRPVYVQPKVMTPVKPGVVIPVRPYRYGYGYYVPTDRVVVVPMGPVERFCFGVRTRWHLRHQPYEIVRPGMKPEVKPVKSEPKMEKDNPQPKYVPQK